MQLTLSLAALAATASASFAVRDVANKQVDAKNFGNAKVVNRCSYDVYLWHVDKQMGCPKSASTLLKKNGGEWQQQMTNDYTGGVSIKLSKFENCGGKELSQLEYKLETTNKAFLGNYLDMSFVDCQNGGDCPGWKDGFYMESGKSSKAKYPIQNDNKWCPILKSSNPGEAAKIAYVLPDDPQTKFCHNDADLVLYICGDQAPGADAGSSKPSPAAPSSSQVIAPSSSSQPKPSTFQVLPSKPASPDNDVKAKAAEVTPAPQAPAAEGPKVVKTVVKYVTVDAPMPKRHAHGRRHNHL